MQGRFWRRLATFKLGLSLALGSLAHAAPPASPNAQLVSYNRRSFLVPFNIPAADVPRYKQVQLWASSNGGASWKQVATTTPIKPFFNFTARTDGEYWFAVRTVDNRGNLFPSDESDIMPNMKVTIDTKKPSMTIEPRARRGNVASINWDVTDEALDLETLAFDYQIENTNEWVPIPIQKQSRIGFESWDAGTSEPVKVRGVVFDKAKNRQSVVVELPGGGASDELLAMPTDLDDANNPPPMGTFASEATRPISSSSPSRRTETVADPDSSGAFDPFTSGNTDRPPSRESAPPTESSNPPIMVASPKFGLQYAVDDAGPNGPAVVELYVTSDGGRTWTSRGEDTDRTSPFQVDLGGEGRFGLKLVAKSAADQGDRPPVAGETPKTTVEVDSSGPSVTLDKPKLEGNRLQIRWKVDEPHPATRPVMISIRPDGPDARWQIITPSSIENTGQYNWLISSKCPPKIQVRVDVRDALGNLGFAETSDSVLVDRSKPKGRILGLDSTAVRATP